MMRQYLQVVFASNQALNMVFYDRSYFELIWKMYGPYSFWFFIWMGSSHQFCTILKVLHFNSNPEKVWKIQSKNCAMTSVAVSTWFTALLKSDEG
jgi:hypothetical protein